MSTRQESLFGVGRPEPVDERDAPAVLAELDCGHEFRIGRLSPAWARRQLRCSRCHRDRRIVGPVWMLAGDEPEHPQPDDYVTDDDRWAMRPDTAPLPGPGPHSFDGATIDEEVDTPRLTGQMAKVYEVLTKPEHQGRWWTLAELGAAVGAPEASVSARLRDLRKPKFGGHDVERQRRVATAGTWEYRLEVRP